MLSLSKLSKKAVSHEDVFLSRYPQLISWSLKMAGSDREKAEDLVHDAYLQWTLVRPDLDSIHNLDGYLYGMLRNMHAAELRRSLRHPTASLSVVEYDSALLSLQRASDELHIAGLQDQLRAVCDYACARKETSKAGSLLLLRFFHGYYPGEAAQIAGIRRVTVDSWLRIARSEAKLYLENPEALKFIKDQPFPIAHRQSPVNKIANRKSAIGNRSGVNGKCSAVGTGATREFLEEVSLRIFQSCQSRCVSNKQLRAFYSQTELQPLDCESLAHISSCQTCLDKATTLLKFPSKDDHYPPDRMGRDPRPGEESIFNRNGNRKVRDGNSFRGHFEEILEHRPKKLHISVNGFTVGTQKITSETIEHSLKLSLPEQIGLVEILSEQGIRLLCLYVEHPPEGAIEQSALIELSDDRALGVSLSFRDPWPNLELTYSDPYFMEVAGDPGDIVETEERTAKVESQEIDIEPPLWRRLISWLTLEAFSEPSWLWPAIATALLAGVLSLTSILIHIHRSPLPVAAELLTNATKAEQVAFARPNEVAHRQINFEQRRLADGAVLAHRRIEVWRDSAKGNVARRLYDHSGTLVAGAWQQSQSAPQEIYHHGSRLKLPPQSQDAPQLVLTDHSWLLEPSAANFSMLVRNMESAGIEAKDNQYILRYRERSPESAGDGRRLIQATLTLDRSNLHATEEVLVIAEGGEQFELRFSETGFEYLPSADVDQKVFEPDTQFLAALVEAVPENVSVVPPALKPTTVPEARLPSPAELTTLEVDVLYLLDQVNANAGEQIEIRRLAAGKLLVQALVETAKRKAEILRALAPVASSRIVTIEVLTIEEALKRESGKSRNPPTVDRIVITKDRIPVYEEVRKYLEREKRSRPGTDKNASPSDLDGDIQRFGGRVIEHSRGALLHAFALKRLVERFSAEDLNSLTDESRRKWYEMISTHCRAFRESTRLLRRDLAPVFPEGLNNNNEETTSVIVTDTSLAETVDQLLKLTMANNDAISQAFAIHPEGKSPGNFGGTSFWNNFTRAEKLAAALERIDLQRPASKP
ncbi:MAG TPA: RNA polymerase sigma factor [Pyrinomonadaceae bacterium]|nr:RNA polymerase sigma factor [Pyrinomonadaceae bacterium]